MRLFRTIVTLALVSVAVPAVAQTAVFTETWENGATRWRTSGPPPIVPISDTAPSCSTNFQREVIPTTGGRAFTTGTGAGQISVTGGQSYCLTAYVRGSAGAEPFLGIVIDDGSGSAAGTQHWLIGAAGFDNGYNGTVVPVTSDDAWHWYKAPFTVEMDASFVDIMDELFFQGSAGTADFDDITLWSGGCPASAPGVDTHQTCGGGTPVCSASGACVAPPDMTVPPPPADLAVPPVGDMAVSGDMSGSAPADMSGSAPADMSGSAPADMSGGAHDLGTSNDLAHGGNDLAHGGGGGDNGCSCQMGRADRGEAGGGVLFLGLAAAFLMLRRRLRRA